MNGSLRAARRWQRGGEEGEPGRGSKGRRVRSAPRAHLPHSRNSATYLSRRRAEWLHSVYRQTSTSSSVSTLRALSLRQGPSRSSCSSFLSRTLADMVPRGPLPTRRPLAARSASQSGRAFGDTAAASPVRVVSPRPRPTSWARSRRRSVWGAGPRGSMGRSPPLSAAALPARLGQPRLGPAARPSAPPAAAPSQPPTTRRPGAARSEAQHKPDRRPSPDPAAQPRGPQPTRARPARVQPTTAGPVAAALTSARRPAPASRLPAPSSRRDRTSPLAVGRPGCWEGRDRRGRRRARPGGGVASEEPLRRRDCGTGACAEGARAQCVSALRLGLSCAGPARSPGLGASPPTLVYLGFRGRSTGATTVAPAAGRAVLKPGLVRVVLGNASPPLT